MKISMHRMKSSMPRVKTASIALAAFAAVSVALTGCGGNKPVAKKNVPEKKS